MLCSQTIWKRFYDKLKDIGVKVPVAKLSKAETCGVYEKTVRAFSFPGPACAKVQSWAALSSLLDIVYPPSTRVTLPDGRPNYHDPNFNQECFDGYQKASRVWEKYNLVWDVLNDLNMNKNEKADEVETLAFEFVDDFSRSYKRTHHLYPHLLMAHVPHQLRLFPR